MKKYLLMVLVNLFFVLTNTKAQDRNNIGTEIVKDYLRKNTQVAKQVDVVASGNFAEYFSSPGFKNELQSGKWGSSVSMLINGIVEKIESNASEKDIDNFQKKLRSSALLDPTLLLAINALGAQIKEIIEKAQAAGQILEVEAANQILTVIEQARQAFRNELDRTLDRISIEANRALNSIKSVINDLEQGIYEHIRDLERRALEISHNLPLSKHFPQVNKWSPSYTYKTSQTYLKESKNWSNFLIVERRTIAQGVVVQSGVLNEDEYIHFEIDGDFYDLPSKNYNAALVINGHTYINKTKSSQDISFDIKKTDLEFNANSIKYNYAKVTIPYKKPVFLIFKRKEIAEFTLPIITLYKALP